MDEQRDVRLPTSNTYLHCTTTRLSFRKAFLDNEIQRNAYVVFPEKYTQTTVSSCAGVGAVAKLAQFCGGGGGGRIGCEFFSVPSEALNSERLLRDAITIFRRSSLCVLWLLGPISVWVQCSRVGAAVPINA
jgi:hypothetical protein